MLAIRKQRLSEIEERVVMAWCESTAPTDPERVTYVARTVGLDTGEVRALMNAPDKRVEQAILYEQSRMDYETGLDPVNLLRAAGRMIHYDVGLLADPDGQPVPLHKLSNEIKYAIAGVKITVEEIKAQGEVLGTRTTYDYKLVDKVSAINVGFKYAGLFSKDNAQKADALQSVLEQVFEEGSRLPLKGAIKPEPHTVPQVGAEVVEAVVVTPVDLPSFENPYK